MADMHSIAGGRAGRIRSELAELGGLADDDSCRAVFLTDALRAVATLADGHDTLSISGSDLASLLKIIGDEAERIHLRQSLDAERRG